MKKTGDILGNYESLMTFVERQYYVNPAYSLGNTCYLQEEFRQYIILWYAWYSGYVDNFHRYSVYNGQEHVRRVRESLQMAKKLCEDKADLLLNEKVDIELTEDGAQDYLNQVLKANFFRSKSNDLIEKIQALGTGAYVEFYERDKVCIDYLTADKVIPITVINGQVINAAFASVSRQGNANIVYLNVHIRFYPIDETYTEKEIEARRELGIPDDYDGYVIENKLLRFVGNRYEQEEVDVPEDMATMWLTNSTIPLFQIIKPAKANNICWDDMGLGVSLYSNALPQLRGTDLVYDSYLSEFELGKKRIFVHDELANIEMDNDGNEKVFKPIFDTNDTVFYAFDMGQDGDKIKDHSPELRIDDHEKGLNRQLNLLGFKCGFGNNYYKFEGGVVKTATEVISENNPLYKSIKKDQHILREAIEGMTKAIIFLENEFGEKSFDVDQDVTVNFDDSIFEDTDKVRKDALVERNAGVIDDVEYFMRVYKLSEEQAIEKVNKMRARKPQEDNIDMMGGGA